MEILKVVIQLTMENKEVVWYTTASFTVNNNNLRILYKYHNGGCPHAHQTDVEAHASCGPPAFYNIKLM